MEPLYLFELSLLIFGVAVLYSAVGHGGASGYLAVLSFTALTPNQMSTTALILNLIVAGIAFLAYYRAGHFRGSLAWPFLITSIPAAFLGGWLHVMDELYYLLLALVLVYAAIRMWWPTPEKSPARKAPSLPVALTTGGGLGFISGVVGVGGGIFLSPLMLIKGWGNAKVISATAACFILVNSASGLAGRFVEGTLLLADLWPLLIAGFLGGLIGGSAGAQKFSNTGLCRLLAVVLLVAAFKMLLRFV